MDVLCLHVDMVEEAVTQLVDGTLCAVLIEREVLVCVEHDHVVETQACLVTMYEFLVDGVQRQTGTKGEHALLAGCLCTFDF